MKPAKDMAKRKKVNATKEVKQNRGGARRKRTPPKTISKKTPDKEPAPYKFSKKSVEIEDATEENPAVPTDKTSLMPENSDNSETGSESEEDDESEEEVGEKIAPSTTINPSPEGNATRKSLFQPEESVQTLKESVDKLQSRNSMLSRQIKNVTKMGGVDRYEVMQLRKMVKEDLFKKVKFITTTATEKKCLQYLVDKLNILPEIQRDWCATYAHCVRDAVNNKRNNVSQDLKVEIKGKKEK